MSIDNIEFKTDSMEVKINMARINRNIVNAQFFLDNAVMTSMVPFMPMEDGSFIAETRARSAALAGSGEVCAAAPPFGRFLYEGKTMVDIETGSPWAKKDNKKVLVSQYSGKTQAREKLQFTKTKHPRAQAHWFEPAKKQDLESWKRVVKNQMSKP